jgi:hypothetical protein
MCTLFRREQNRIRGTATNGVASIGHPAAAASIGDPHPPAFAAHGTAAAGDLPFFQGEVWSLRPDHRTTPTARAVAWNDNREA